MEESDIKEIIKMLKTSIKNDDWDLVQDSIDYMNEFLEDVEEEEEE